MRVLITGAAGFIGHATARRLLDEGDEVLGLDNFTPYYDPALKRARLRDLEGRRGFDFQVGELADFEGLARRMDGVDVVVHLAAQPGVRHALRDPFTYQRTNVGGLLHVLEAVRRRPAPPRLVWASSSSVYGGNRGTPFAETDRVDDPISLYAATKRAGELIAHSYRHLFGLPAVGLRFFTVYGPWGRPDMAYWKFTEALLEDRPIEVYGSTAASRDMTYIDDIVDGVVAAVRRPVTDEVLNLGDAEPVTLERLITTVERAVGRKAKRLELPAQPGDVETTFADVKRAGEVLGYAPKVRLDEGIPRFVEWFRGWRGDGR